MLCQPLTRLSSLFVREHNTKDWHWRIPSTWRQDIFTYSEFPRNLSNLRLLLWLTWPLKCPCKQKILQMHVMQLVWEFILTNLGCSKNQKSCWNISTPTDLEISLQTNQASSTPSVCCLASSVLKVRVCTWPSHPARIWMWTRHNWQQNQKLEQELESLRSASKCILCSPHGHSSL